MIRENTIRYTFLIRIIFSLAMGKAASKRTAASRKGSGHSGGSPSKIGPLALVLLGVLGVLLGALVWQLQGRGRGDAGTAGAGEQGALLRCAWGPRQGAAFMCSLCFHSFGLETGGTKRMESLILLFYMLTRLSLSSPVGFAVLLSFFALKSEWIPCCSFCDGHVFSFPIGSAVLSSPLLTTSTFSSLVGSSASHHVQFYHLLCSEE